MSHLCVLCNYVSSYLLVSKANVVHNTFLVYLSISACFGRLCAYQHEKQLCLCDAWYLLFCVDDCLVCRSICSCIPDSHYVKSVRVIMSECFSPRWNINWRRRRYMNQMYVNPEVERLLTYSIVQSPFWEANWFAASQEIPRISRNPKVHYRTHKRPPLVSILGPPSPVHIPTSHLLEIHSNIIHPSTPRPPQWSLSLRFSHQFGLPFLL